MTQSPISSNGQHCICGVGSTHNRATNFTLVQENPPKYSHESHPYQLEKKSLKIRDSKTSF